MKQTKKHAPVFRATLHVYIKTINYSANGSIKICDFYFEYPSGINTSPLTNESFYSTISITGRLHTACQGAATAIFQRASVSCSTYLYRTTSLHYSARHRQASLLPSTVSKLHRQGSGGAAHSALPCPLQCPLPCPLMSAAVSTNVRCSVR